MTRQLDTHTCVYSSPFYTQTQDHFNIDRMSESIFIHESTARRDANDRSARRSGRPSTELVARDVVKALLSPRATELVRVASRTSHFRTMQRMSLKRAGGRASASERRREATLVRQRESKRDALAYARSIAIGGGSDEAMRGADDAERRAREADSSSSSAAGALPNTFEEVLTMPEWMWDDAPRDLREKWYVRPRPRGTRCLVVASRGKTVARSARDGTTLSTFQSALPGGSARTSRGRGGDCFCILDCVFTGDERARKDYGRRDGVSSDAEASRSGRYYVLDVMAWNGASMYECDVEFRFFWAHTRLTQECEACEAPNRALGRDFAFVATPWFEATAEGLEVAYAGDVGAELDGLIFYHREAAYETGTTPLVLNWRDARTSAFFNRDEGAPGVLERAGVVMPDATSALAAQIVTLAKSNDGAFFITGDDEPVVIAATGAVSSAPRALGSPIEMPTNRLGRFLVGPNGFDVDAETAVVRSADLLYLGVKPERKPPLAHAAVTRAARLPDRADALSKILFNARSRNAPLSIERIIQVARESDVMAT